MVVVALQDANCNSNSLACADHGLKFNPEDEKSNAVTGRRDGEDEVSVRTVVAVGGNHALFLAIGVSQSGVEMAYGSAMER